MKQLNAISVTLNYFTLDTTINISQPKMLDLSNSTIYTDLEHNGCTIALLIIHIVLLLWTLFSCSMISIVVHLLPSLQSLQHTLVSQYSVIGYLTALFCYLMSSIDVIMLGEWRLGSIACNIWYTVDTMLNITSAWLSTALMLDRLISIEAPQFYLNLSKKCKTLVSCCPWVLSALLTLLGIGLQHGAFYNLVTNKSSSIDQCYIVDSTNEISIYFAVVSFLLPYVVTLLIFVVIKLRISSKQKRLTISRSLESLSDVLLDNDPEDSPYPPECNYTSTPEDALRKVDNMPHTCHPHRQSSDVCDKPSFNGSDFLKTGDLLEKKRLSSRCHFLRNTRQSRCSKNATIAKLSRMPDGTKRKKLLKSSPITRRKLAREKGGSVDHEHHEKRPIQVYRREKPDPFPHLHKKPAKRHPPSAYITALHKAKQKYRVNQTYGKINDESDECVTPPQQSRLEQSPATCVEDSRSKRIGHVYVDQKRIPMSLDQRDHSPQHTINLFCSLHGKQCQSVARYVDNAEASSSDSESSQSLIKKDDNTGNKPKRDHIIMTDILHSEQLKTVQHIALVAFLYATLWLPFYVLRILLVFSPQTVVYHYIYTSLHLLGYSSSGICPWLYYLLQGYINSSTWSKLKYRLLNPSTSDSMSISTSSI